MAGEEPRQSLDKKVVRTSPVLWFLGLVFALLLGAIGTRGLSDLADLFREPQLEEYRAPRVDPIDRERAAILASPDPRQVQITRAERDLTDFERTLSTAEESWRTWLTTRAALGGTLGEDREVRRRRDQLDQLRKERDDAARAVAQLRLSPDGRAAALAELDHRQRDAMRDAEDELDAAHRRWAWKVLSARLCLVVPVWLGAAWLWTRRRSSKYLTLLWGYWAFSLWMLLWGIGPYLPHYGGYGPLALGIAVTAWGSVSLVRFFNRRAPARRQRIVDDAIIAHRCPGCDRDYLIGREVGLDLIQARRGMVRHFDAAALRPHACPGCGLPLFGACAACEHEQLVHLDHCAACGASFRAPA
jgi:hypothetical protein